MSQKPVFLYAASYQDEESAQADYEIVKALHHAGVIGTYDAVIVAKDEEGKVHVRKHEKPTQHGAWTGVVAGAATAVLFPVGLLVGVAGGAAIGGLIGHVWRGIPRKEAAELGEVLDDGEAGLVVVGRERLAERLDKELTRANRRIEKQINVEDEDFEGAVDTAVRSAGQEPAVPAQPGAPAEQPAT